MPRLPDFWLEVEDLEEKFCREVQAMPGKVLYEAEYPSLRDLIAAHFPNEKIIASTLPDCGGSVDLKSITRPAELESAGLAVLPARFGVAENGAVWLTDQECGHRVLPFIAQHLVVVLKKENLVRDMHEAYLRAETAGGGFGVFIAGPSKTADIEQSLVVGAQGARSFTVVFAR